MHRFTLAANLNRWTKLPCRGPAHNFHLSCLEAYSDSRAAAIFASFSRSHLDFNPGWKDPNLYDDQVRGTASIIAAIKKAGIKRVLWVGGAGGLEVKPGVRVVDSPDLPSWVRPGSLATIDALDQLRKEPELEWSYLSPSAELKPGQRTGKFRLGNDQLLVDTTGKSQISIQDYAVAMIDEPERPAHVRRRFTVGY